MHCCKLDDLLVLRKEELKKWREIRTDFGAKFGLLGGPGSGTGTGFGANETGSSRSRNRKRNRFLETGLDLGQVWFRPETVVGLQ